MDAEQTLGQNPQEYAVEDDQLMSPTQKRFYASALCDEARNRLQALVNSSEYNTNPSRLTGSSVLFVDRHLHYLSMYPKTNLDGYISNLKLMTSTKHSKPAS